ncbi:aminotransferase class I/II-fold pyridoxal phosphate-dependent enzyme [Elongatibacter sediminis]|uniref:Aminotransferase class I/II-fold pyridoxal phosphate-dependent enzyme n=1 Tax=Elongatibacter sediminis TaxID=3119006 RepID=A0AAW9R635_9GAMM
MRAKIHMLFEQFLGAMQAQPEASVVHSLAASPRLGDFLQDLDPDLSLDWSGQSFQGLPELRERIVTRLGHAPVCSADDVLVTAGTAEANFLAISNLVGPGDEMIVDVPGWPQPLVLGEAIGADVRRLPRHESRGWAFDLDELAALITPRTRLIFLCNPNNPTGHLLNEQELGAVIDLASDVGAWVLTDEVYRGLEWEDRPTPSAANLYERGISTGSVSKALGLQGLRTGWLICRDAKLIFDSVVLREDTSEIMNIMGEAIARIAMSPERYRAAIDRARSDGRRNLEVLERFIASNEYLEWHRPQAGLITFCRLRGPLQADAFSKRLLAPPYRTFVMPGSAYGYPDHLRLGVGGGNPEALERGLEHMQTLLSEL